MQKHVVTSGLVGALLLWLASPARADESLAMKGNRGFEIGLSPGILFGASPLYESTELRFAYGFPVGPFVLAPGASLSAFIPLGSDANVAAAGVAQVRLMLPLPMQGILAGVAPYVHGGAGVFGGFGGTVGSGLVGGGVMFHPITKVGIGVQYQAFIAGDVASNLGLVVQI